MGLVSNLLSQDLAIRLLAPMYAEHHRAGRTMWSLCATLTWRAYQKALARHGIPFDSELVFQTGLDGGDGTLLADAVLDRADRATAIILIFEGAAVGIYERLAELGLQPGRDLSVIGLRNELVVQHLRPRLTCFELSLFEVGVALGEALLAQLSSTAKRGGPFAQVRIPLTIRPGESDGPPLPSESTKIGQRRPGGHAAVVEQT